MVFPLDGVDVRSFRGFTGARCPCSFQGAHKADGITGVLDGQLVSTGVLARKSMMRKAGAAADLPPATRHGFAFLVCLSPLVGMRGEAIDQLPRRAVLAVLKEIPRKVVAIPHYIVEGISYPEIPMLHRHRSPRSQCPARGAKFPHEKVLLFLIWRYRRFHLAKCCVD
jgi:hypothetical protein